MFSQRESAQPAQPAQQCSTLAIGTRRAALSCCARLGRAAGCCCSHLCQAVCGDVRRTQDGRVQRVWRVQSGTYHSVTFNCPFGWGLA